MLVVEVAVQVALGHRAVAAHPAHVGPFAGVRAVVHLARGGGPKRGDVD